MQFTPALALYDPFGVDVPLNFDITHSLVPSYKSPKVQERAWNVSVKHDSVVVEPKEVILLGDFNNNMLNRIEYRIE